MWISVSGRLQSGEHFSVWGTHLSFLELWIWSRCSQQFLSLMQCGPALYCTVLGVVLVWPNPIVLANFEGAACCQSRTLGAVS